MHFIGINFILIPNLWCSGADCQRGWTSGRALGHLGLASGDFYCPSFLLNSRFCLVLACQAKSNLHRVFVGLWRWPEKCVQTNPADMEGREGVLGKEGLPIKGLRPTVIFFWRRFWTPGPPAPPPTPSCSTQHFTFARQRQGVFCWRVPSGKETNKCPGMSFGSSYSVPGSFAVPHILTSVDAYWLSQ